MTAVPAPPGYAVSAAVPADREQILALAAAVVAADPGFNPPVAHDRVSLVTWFDRRVPDWRRVVRGPDGQLVGYVAVSHTPVPHSLWPTLPESAVWEANRLLVHPDHRRRGLGRLLLAEVTGTFRSGVWTVCHRDDAGHRLLTALGWQTRLDLQHADRDDAVPSVVVLAPDRR